MVMKRYLVFAGGYYYPSGGWNDYVGMMDDLDAAISYAKAKAQAVGDGSSWWHIVDTTVGQIIARGEIKK